MAHLWPIQGISLEHFHPSEFRNPGLMDPAWLRDLDTLRMRCGFALRITSDARTQAEHRALYQAEIDAGESYPKASAHLAWPGSLVRCVDLKPSQASAASSLELTYQILRMHEEGRWPSLGLGIETKHWHIDDTPRLGSARPAFWVAPSR